MKLFVVFLIGLVLGVTASVAYVWKAAPDLMVAERASPLDTEATVARLVASAEAVGWKVLGIRKLHESIHKHTGKTVAPVHLVDLCQPDLAARILGDDGARPVSVFMPCTMSVYEKADGKTYVASTNAKLMGLLFGGTVADVMGGPVADAQAGFLEALDAPEAPSAPPADEHAPDSGE